jgi:microcystin-dependent protein
MSDFFIGQIMLTGFGFAQRGFAQCNGQLMPINQNQALFSLLGTSYGGDGRSNFALPNLQGSTPVGAGSSVAPNWQPSPYPIGAQTGVENVALNQGNMSNHTHNVAVTTQSGTVRVPTNSIYGSFANEALYGNASSGMVALNTAQVRSTGTGQPHNNMQPFRVINFNIALTGIFPSRS